jgi:hypothetical protein
MILGIREAVAVDKVCILKNVLYIQSTFKRKAVNFELQ